LIEVDEGKGDVDHAEGVRLDGDNRTIERPRDESKVQAGPMYSA